MKTIMKTYVIFLLNLLLKEQEVDLFYKYENKSKINFFSHI